MDESATLREVKKSACQTEPRFSIHGVRYLFTAAGFFGYCAIYAFRVNINVAIVAMVNGSAVYNKTASSNECLSENYTETFEELQTEDGEFSWSSDLQGAVLGAFYYGYCISQIPGGMLAERYGGKRIFGVAVLITAILTLLTPVAARTSVILLVALRVCEGLTQGVTMPAMHSMLGRWLPDSEKNFLATVVYNGINVGTLVTMPLAGWLCSSNFLGGWPSAFYVFGVFGCVWYVMWELLITDSPSTHPWITASELNYITSNQKINTADELPPIPWIPILKSVPFWALVITQFGQDWCFYTVLTDLPTFMATILHFKIEKNGLLSSLPYVSQMVVSSSVGYVVDTLIRRKCCSLEYSRKICNTVGCVTTSIGLVAICLIGCDVNWTVAIFAVSVGLGGFSACGYVVNHLDLSPEFAGTLMGISNTISNMTGFIAPAVVGALTMNQQTRHQWSIVFLITVGILLVTSAVFIIFGSTEKQDWPSPKKCQNKQSYVKL